MTPEPAPFPSTIVVKPKKTQSTPRREEPITTEEDTAAGEEMEEAFEDRKEKEN